VDDATAPNTEILECSQTMLSHDFRDN